MVSRAVEKQNRQRYVWPHTIHTKVSACSEHYPTNPDSQRQSNRRNPKVVTDCSVFHLKLHSLRNKFLTHRRAVTLLGT